VVVLHELSNSESVKKKDNLILIDCISEANSSSFSNFNIPEDD
jgi:hypothetical protein